MSGYENRTATIPLDEWVSLKQKEAQFRERDELLKALSDCRELLSSNLTHTKVNEMIVRLGKLLDSSIFKVTL